jgi:signal peptidase I
MSRKSKKIDFSKYERKKINKKVIIFSVIGLVLLIFIILLISNLNKEKIINYNTNESIKEELTNIENQNEFSCIRKTEKQIVSGNSMSGIIEQNEEINILYGFYDCNEIKRNNIVVVNYSGSEIPLIKLAKGLPGDNFYLEKKDNYWHLIINNEIVKNSNNEEYQINQAGQKMINLYVNDFNKTIPLNTYLVLGNLISGSTDSTKFGLIDKSSIIGKGEIIE